MAFLGENHEGGRGQCLRLLHPPLMVEAATPEADPNVVKLSSHSMLINALHESEDGGGRREEDWPPLKGARCDPMQTVEQEAARGTNSPHHCPDNGLRPS